MSLIYSTKPSNEVLFYPILTSEEEKKKKKKKCQMSLLSSYTSINVILEIVSRHLNVLYVYMCEHFTKGCYRLLRLDGIKR